jgi:hypothetical protein
MNLKPWLNSASDAERLAVAEKAETTVAYLWQIAGSHREAGAKLARRIATATEKITPDRVVTAADLRPDIFEVPANQGSAA